MNLEKLIEYDPILLAFLATMFTWFVTALGSSMVFFFKTINKKIDEKKLKLPKIENLSFHVSRHSYAQYAVESGLDVYELMHTLRHSKLETTQKYLKSLNEELADKAMSKVF